MTQAQNEIQSTIMKAQEMCIDVYAILSKREYAFLNGSFMPNNNYARQLRLCIRRKLEKALGFPNGQEGKTLTAQGINPQNTNHFTPVLNGTQPCNSGHPVESTG